MPRSIPSAWLAAALLAACSDSASSSADATLDAADTGSDAVLTDAADAVDDTPDAAGETGPDASADAGPIGVLHPAPEYGTYRLHPEPPANLRDVALIDDDVAFTRPYVPGHRTTTDGRVGIRVQGGPPGTEREATQLSFYLFAPERLEEPIMPGAPGAAILANPEPFDVVFPPALDPSVERLGHHAICDPTLEFPVEGERPNPYTCGEGGADDCYDITVISSTSPNVGAQMWGTPVTVRVSDPKTADAQIADVTLGEPVAGAFIELTGEWTEPAVTMDGRLLTGRWGRAPRQWTNPNTGETMFRPWDLAYSVLPEDAEPCDVTGWTTFHPMSHAPYDPQMVGTYGLAAYPFRDAEGNPIADGEDLGGTYPWVDREGANVFMAGVPGRMVEQSEEVFPRRCVTEGCETYSENTDWDRGFLVAGLWTHGKFVHLDAMINNMDWAVGVTPASHYWVDLYQTPDGDAVPVRFGSGRFIDRVRNAGGPYPDGYTHNANILDSLQNLPNHTQSAVPVTPRDVVWIMSTGVATDEVVFDDFLDPNALIVSSMQGSITPHYNEDGETTSFPVYHNGQVRRLELPLPVASFYKLFPDEHADVHVQNAATSLDWNVPPYGHIDAGDARIEPAAIGGVVGKGLWLSGEAEVVYEMPEQTRDVDAADRYIALFVDPRTPPAEVRNLLRFPDGSVLRLGGTERLRYVSEGRTVHEVALPPSDGWIHLGLEVREAGRRVILLRNGIAVDRFDSPVPLFGVGAGELIVAGDDDDGYRGFRGWVDELKVLAYVPNVEVACNHAGGTLIRTAPGADVPEWSHARIAAAANMDGGTFDCFTDLTRDYGAHLANLPEGSSSVREAINFPEGPIRSGAPRPDSTGNAFCRTCHTPTSLAGLSIGALGLRPDVPAEHDPRRQPLQPPRRVFGNIPAGWIPPGAGPGSPRDAVQAPASGALIDHWILPQADRPGPG